MHRSCEQQLTGIDFIGGTFVEYEQGSDKELYRGTISTFACRGDAIVVDTEESDAAESPFKLGTPHLKSSQCTLLYARHGFYAIDTGPYLGWKVAIAPAGVDIPKDRRP